MKVVDWDTTKGLAGVPDPELVTNAAIEPRRPVFAYRDGWEWKYLPDEKVADALRVGWLVRLVTLREEKKRGAA